MISIDGLMPTSYTSASSPAVNLKKLAAEGAWAEGVVDNRMFAPENTSDGAWYW